MNVFAGEYCDEDLVPLAGYGRLLDLAAVVEEDPAAAMEPTGLALTQYESERLSLVRHLAVVAPGHEGVAR